MIRKSTWLVLVIFLVLLAGVLILQKTGDLEFTAQPTANPTEVSVLGLGTGSITQVQVDAASGESATFVIQADGAWTASAPEGFQPDSATVESAISNVSSWTIQDDLAIAPALEDIGLNDPMYVLTFTIDGAQQHVVSVGNLNPAQTGYYLRLDGGSPFLVNRYSVDPVIKLLDLLKVTPSPEPTVVGTLEITATP